MLTSLVVLLTCLVGAVALALVPGGWLPFDAMAAAAILAGLSVGAALRVLLLGAARLLRRLAPPVVDTRPRIVVDGSNVMFWEGEVPRLATVTAVLDTLIARGLAPVVYFDANVGYQLFDRFAGSYAMTGHLPAGVAEVVVVGKGDPADPILIARALADRARIVSNDRFRDWRGRFPKVGEKGVLLGGEVRGGQVRLRW